MKARWLVAGALIAGGAAGAVLLRSAMGQPVPVVQPIPFNHQVHVKGQEMQCTDCHQGDKEARSGFADIRSCNECHKQVQGEKPTKVELQEKVKEYGKARKQIPWVQVNEMPGHVYFSHRAHVTFGGMKCEECHGDMGERTEPLSVPNAKLRSMSRCIACHQERGASLQCVACHK